MANRHHLSEDGGLSLYREIAEGGSAYLKKHDLEAFYLMFSMTTKAKARLLHELTKVKEALQSMVVDQLEDQTKGIPDDHWPYLTCTQIRDHEMPWNHAK